MQRDVGVWRAGGGDRRRLGVTMTEDFRAGRELAPGLYDWRGALHVDEERFSAPPAATRPTRPTWPPPGRRSAASRRGTAPPWRRPSGELRLRRCARPAGAAGRLGPARRLQRVVASSANLTRAARRGAHAREAASHGAD
jgi:hypothetical protein